MEFEEIRNLFNISENNGYSEEELKHIFNKYESIPKVLINYYIELGKYMCINEAQNILCNPEDLIDTGEYIIFYKENQYTAQWAIKKTDLNKDNPPVYYSLNEHDFKLENNDMKSFLNSMAYFQGVSGGLNYCSDDIYMISEKEAELIRSHYNKIDYGIHEWLNISYYGNFNDEVICLIENEGYDMLYGSSNEEHFKEIEQFVNDNEFEY